MPAWGWCFRKCLKFITELYLKEIVCNIFFFPGEKLSVHFFDLASMQKTMGRPIIDFQFSFLNGEVELMMMMVMSG